MVVYYDLETKEMIRTEDYTMEPLLPMNTTFEEKKEFYKSQGQGFISLPYEMGMYVLNFRLCFDNNGIFTGLQPK